MTRACGGTILIVDDHPDIGWLLCKLMSVRGHTVKAVQTSAAAVAAIQGYDCQVAVVDYRLPDGNGLDLMGRLTAIRPSLLIILMTSFGTPTLHKALKSIKLFAYFDKPFNNQDMVAAVEAAIEEAERRS